MEYTEHLLSLGFQKGKASPCNFRHEAMDISLTVHGDDFLVAGPLNSVRWLQTKMRAKYEIKTDILGPIEEGCKQEIHVLGRTLRWTKKGIEYEADARHAKLIIEGLGLDNAKSVATPGTKDERKLEDVEGEEVLMDPSEARKFRGIAARVNYLAVDRADLQYSAKECCKKMANPVTSDWVKLKRVGRYLKRFPRLTQLLPWESKKYEITGHADSDWAGDKRSAKSTSGGALYLGQSLIKSWSCNQSVIALSSGEAELYALTKLTTQCVGMISLAGDFGCVMRGKVKSDSTAAIAIASRNGLGGKSRHIRVQYLWIQDALKGDNLKLEKVLTTLNTADVLTKFLTAEIFWNHVTKMGYRVPESPNY